MEEAHRVVMLQPRKGDHLLALWQTPVKEIVEGAVVIDPALRSQVTLVKVKKSRSSSCPLNSTNANGIVVRVREASCNSCREPTVICLSHRRTVHRTAYLAGAAVRERSPACAIAIRDPSIPARVHADPNAASPLPGAICWCKLEVFSVLSSSVGLSALTFEISCGQSIISRWPRGQA